MEIEYLFQNVNLGSINFVNNKNDIKFIFLNSYNGDYHGELLCLNILSLKMSTDMDEDKDFPKFVVDIIAKKGINYYVKFEGGEYYIEITCEMLEVKK